MWNNLQFQNSEAFYLLLLLPLVVFWYFYKQKKKSPTFTLSSLAGIRSKSLKESLANLSWVFQIGAAILLIIALARPQTTDVKNKKIGGEGIDIVMAIDISASMLAEDFKPNRLESAKKTTEKFVSNRGNDRIGLVVYAGEGFTQCPLTTDHSVLKRTIGEVNIDMIKMQGTAIGMGLATAVNRLKDSKAKSKVIILLTDGVNNSGTIDPMMAAEIASTFNIRTYTIGVGTNGEALTPYAYDRFTGELIKQYMPVEIDEETLKKIAEMTDGQYFRATDEKGLTRIYEEIDTLEKTKLEELNYVQYEEKFFNFVLLAIVLLILDSILKYTYLRSAI